MPAPKGLRAMAGETSVRCSWSRVARSGLAGYRLERASSPRGPWKLVTTTRATAFIDRVVTSRAWYYRVRARGPRGVNGRASAAVRIQRVPAPGGLEALAGDRLTSVRWSPVGGFGALSYSLERAGTSTGPWTTAGTSAAVSFDDLGGDSGGSYYRVRTVIAGVMSPPSAPGRARKIPVPVGLTVLGQGADVACAWTAITSPDVTEYVVERAAAEAGPWAEVARTSSASFRDASAPEGDLFYRVRAVGSRDLLGSAGTAVRAVRLPVVSGLRVVGGAAANVLAWTAADPGLAATYVVDRALSPAGPWVTIATPSAPTFSDTSFAGADAWYRVRMVSSTGASGIVCAAVAAERLPVPSGLSVVGGDTANVVTWGAPASAAGLSYIVERAATSQGPWARVFRTSGTTFWDATTPAGECFYRVSVVDGAGITGSACAPVLALRVPAPAGLSALAGESSVRCTWGSVDASGLTGYRLESAVSSAGPWTTVYEGTGTAYAGGAPAGAALYRVRVMVGELPCRPTSAVPVSLIAAPTGLAVTAGDMVNVCAWTGPASDIGSFQVERADDPAGPWALAGATDVPAFVDAVPDAKPTFYRVRALGPGGLRGLPSSAVSNAKIAMSGLVASSGATLRAANGQLTLTLAPGTFLAPTTVSVSQSTAATPANLIGATPGYEFSADSPLLVPAQVTAAFRLPEEFASVAGSVGRALDWMSLETSTGAWVPVPTSVDATASTLTAAMPHFSEWRGAMQPHGTSVALVTANSCNGVCHTVTIVSGRAIVASNRSIAICYVCHAGPAADSPTGALTDGHNIKAEFLGYASFDPATQSRHPVLTGTATASSFVCVTCHDPHKSPTDAPHLLRATDAVTGKPVASAAGAEPGNPFCWACHGTKSNARINIAVSGYYARTGGDRKTGFVASAHAVKTCADCHAPHGATNPTLTNAAARPMCLGCHPEIAPFVSTDGSGLGVTTGHRIKSVNASLPVEAGLPCDACHDPHGSVRGNTKMLSDVLGGGLDTSSAAGVRRFCLTCHTTPDGYGWNSTAGAYAAVPASARVQGLLRLGGTLGSGPRGAYNWLLLVTTGGHARTDTQSCYLCHGSDYSAGGSNVHSPGLYTASGHTANPSGTVVIRGTTFDVACTDCHSVELGPEHGDDCGKCHPSPRDTLAPWNKSCVQGGCHTTGSTAPMHENIDLDHTPLATGAPAACAVAGCHDAAGGLAAIHIDASKTVDGDVRTSCGVCHADGVPASKDCTVCHPGDPHPVGTHTVGGPCIASGCHATDAKTIHDSIAPAGPGCSACHAAGKTASFACRECHTAPHSTVDHTSSVGCDACHTVSNLSPIHGDNCTTCHPTPQSTMGTWNQTCEQAGCHTAPLHPWATYDHWWSEMDSWGYCWDCHPDSSYDDGCSCHPNAYERAAPVTTADARASYTSYAVIRLTAVDQGEWGSTSGIKATYYQVDGGALQAGGTVVVAGPASGVKNHTVEFWSIDWNHNTEAHHIVHFAVAAGPPDTGMPTGAMSVNGGATYASNANVTVNSNVVDAETGVVAMRVDPGSGTYGSWTDYSPAYPITLSGADGNKTVRAQYRDAGNNVLDLTDTIIMDATPPAGTMVINNNAASTSSTSVTLNSAVSDAFTGMDQMRFSNDWGGTWSAWEPYAATKSWTLPAGSGWRYVYAQYTDRAGGSLFIYDGINLVGDVTPPTGSVSINAGASWTNAAAVTLTLSASDTGGSGLSQMRFSNDNAAWSGWETYATSKAWTLAAGTGRKYVYVQYRDVALNQSGSFSDYIDVETTPPTGSITVNSGAIWSTTTAVTLGLSASDAGGSALSQMRFSNDSVTWSGWEAYATSKSWTLTAGNGAKTVYVQYRDGALNQSISYSDGIGLDGTPPTGTMTVNNDAASTGSTAVTLNSAVTDTGGSGLSQMQFSNDNVTWSGWETYAATKSWTLTGGNGAKTVYAQYRDQAGNLLATSDVITLSVVGDTTPPTGSITIDAGVAWTNTTAVTLTLSAVDTGGSGLSQMQFSNDSVTWSGWEAYATSKSWTLTAGNGAKTVYVQYRDGALNQSISYSDGIGLDGTPPTGTMIVNNDAASTGSTAVTLNSAVTDTGGSGLSQMRFSNDNVTWSGWETYAATKNWTLTGSIGTNTVYAQYRDQAGSVLATSDAILLSALRADFGSTGADQFFTVPAGVTTLTVNLYGAQGGNYTEWSGGYGGYVYATIPVTAGQVLTVRVGAQGDGGYIGGWPNGGNAGHGAGGGGSTSLLLGGAVWAEAGAGGGGSCDDGDGGVGGYQGWLPGGNQPGGSGDGSGGGGGWNGGAGGLADHGADPGSGGSSYIAVGTGTMAEGANSGNGSVSITWEVDAAQPHTTSNVQSAYNGAATITLTGDDGLGGSGIAATYYRLDGGPQTAGTVVPVAAPSSGTAPHTIEFWSVDRAGNIESPHHTEAFEVAAPWGTIEFAWDAPSGSTAQVKVYDGSNNLVYQASDPDWSPPGWFIVRVPVSSQPYRLETTWYDSYYDEDGGGTNSALIDTVGKTFTWWY